MGWGSAFGGMGTVFGQRKNGWEGWSGYTHTGVCVKRQSLDCSARRLGLDVCVTGITKRHGGFEM